MPQKPKLELIRDMRLEAARAVEKKSARKGKTREIIPEPALEREKRIIGNAVEILSRINKKLASEVALTRGELPRAVRKLAIVIETLENGINKPDPKLTKSQLEELREIARRLAETRNNLIEQAKQPPSSKKQNRGRKR